MFELTVRLLDYVSNYVTRWMVIRSQERQDPAYRATLLYLRWAQVKTALTFVIFTVYSFFKTSDISSNFYGQIMDI